MVLVILMGTSLQFGYNLGVLNQPVDVSLLFSTIYCSLLSIVLYSLLFSSSLSIVLYYLLFSSSLFIIFYYFLSSTVYYSPVAYLPSRRAPCRCAAGPTQRFVDASLRSAADDLSRAVARYEAAPTCCFRIHSRARAVSVPTHSS